MNLNFKNIEEISKFGAVFFKHIFNYVYPQNENEALCFNTRGVFLLPGQLQCSKLVTGSLACVFSIFGM